LLSKYPDSIKKNMLHHDKQILLVVGDVFVKTVSDCCITPNEHFFSYSISWREQVIFDEMMMMICT
jgi:hypothetical protein